MQPATVKICVAAILLGGLIWAAPAFGEPNANSIACPSAPSGWTNPPGEGGRLVQSPDPSDATQNGLQLGTDQVRITCSYFKNGSRMTVAVAYALPIDFNPWWDFDFGCTSVNHTPGFLPVTGFPWDTVLNSNDPSCPTGSTGRLTVSTEPSVKLDICGGTLLQGTQVATAQISNT